MSNWMSSVYSYYYPWGNFGYFNNNNIENYYFDNIIHLIRNPFDLIPSIIIENRCCEKYISYNYRKLYIKNILNINLPEYTNNLSILDEIEIAIKIFLYWAKLCEKICTFTVKIENLEILNKFNKNNINIDNFKNIKYNSHEIKYSTQNIIKPNIDIETLNKININIKNKLKFFCEKYNYEYILK